MSREWDAERYAGLTLPHEHWGKRTLARLELIGEETVIDAGCGPGRDTALLLDRLPYGKVIALDGSAAMLHQLQRRLADRLERVEPLRADLTKPLPVEDGINAVFSVAAFHWIPDHADLFENIADVLAPGGQLVFECGGEGNISSVNTAVEGVMSAAPPVWNFAGVEETSQRLEKAGFTDIEVSLREDPAIFTSRDELCNYLGTVVLGAHLDRLDPNHHDSFVRSIADRLSDLTVDYVRLEVKALRVAA